jgi:hypothetical protein
MSNVVPLKVWTTYKVTFNRSTDYVAKVVASTPEDAKHTVLQVLAEEDMELMQEMLVHKSTTYTNVIEVKE